MASILWTAGRLIASEALAIPAADRVFEHGIGLFETFRTWGGRPVFLGRHLARLRASARALGLSIDPPELPDRSAVAALREAAGLPPDALFRIVLTGGGPGCRDARLWMRAGHLPTPIAGSGARLVLGGFGLDFDDPLARHKTLNYWKRRLAYERALVLGADEALLGTPDGRIWEGTRMNVFLIHGGCLATPGRDGPCLPGVMRGTILKLARDLYLRVEERDLRATDLDDASEVFLTNSVRGVVPVAHTPGRDLEAPGHWTERLAQALDRLVGGRSEGLDP